ncbi:MAG: hypothetical protein KC503_21630 [Myxococcales bacterium]|nr:hypothetical protein [Myxococcales bacterium]
MSKAAPGLGRQETITGPLPRQEAGTTSAAPAPSTPQGNDKLRRVVAISLLAAASAGLVIHALLYNFVCDDAYISFRYSWNFAFHNEMVFNLGERVEGYTNFLWTLLLGLLLKVGLKPEVMSLVFGAVFGAAAMVLVVVLTRVYRGGRQNGWDFLAALLLPTWGTYAVWCSGGLETQMFCALAMGGVTLYVAEHAGRTKRRWSGLLFALAAMTRPEGMMLFGLTGMHRLATNLIGERRLLPTKAEIFWVLGFLVPFGIFFAWRYSYYGWPLPNTYYVKSGGGLAILKRWGLPYLWDFVNQNRLYVLAPLLFVFRPRTDYDRTRDDSELGAGEHQGVRPAFVWSYVALLVLPYVGYVAWMGGDFMAMGRFFLPIMPLLAFFAQEALREVVERFPRPWSRERAGFHAPRFAVVALLLVGLGIVNSAGLYRANKKLRYHRWGLDTIAYLKKFADDRVIIGNYMRKHLPKDTYYSVGGAGASVYASRLKALDAFGLSDEWIAHHVPAGSSRPGHSKFAPEHYVMRRKPDLLCHIGKHVDYLYRPRRWEVQSWRRKGYRWVCLNPPNVRPRYYCCLKRIDRDLGPYLIEANP